MCVERGSYCTIREVDHESQYQQAFFSITSSDSGHVEAPTPMYSDMIKGRYILLKHIVLNIGGENYCLQSSSAVNRKYIPLSIRLKASILLWLIYS